MNESVTMTDATDNSVFTLLGINEGDRVRLIGDAPGVFDDDRTLPLGVVISSLASVSAEVGVIIVESQADLRERLFTELNGLQGANRVWVLSSSANPDAPREEAISSEAAVVSWTAKPAITIPGGYLAVEVTAGA